MNDVEKEKLIKLLMLSTSENDHESLNAIRFANKLLIKNNTSWDLLLRKANADYSGIFRKQNYNHTWQQAPMSDEIDDMFFTIRKKAWAGFDFDFIDSLENAYQKFRRLTPKQMQALRRVHEKVNSG